MANGWARDRAVQDQIDDTIEDAVLQARALNRSPFERSIRERVPMCRRQMLNN